EILGPLEEAIRLLRDHGAIVENIPFQFGMNLEELISFFNKMWYAGLATAYGSLYDRFPSQFSLSVARMIESGRQLSAIELRETEMKRTIIWNTLQQELDRYDAILSPVVGVTAFSHQIEGPDTINGRAAAPISDWMMTQLYNCTGHPAISIPVGKARSGLPVGLQAATGKFNDALLFRIAYTLEQEKGFEFPMI
ncbi:amidase family protein, partial [Micrococcus sp. SIMBA_131]